MDEPPNHWAKSVFAGVIMAAGAACVVLGLAAGAWALATIGAGDFLFGALLSIMIRRGRNPRWMQGALDRRAAAAAGVTPPETTPTIRQSLWVAAAVFTASLVAGGLSGSAWAPLGGIVVVAVAWTAWDRMRRPSR